MMNKVHRSKYIVHIGNTNMYHDSKQIYWRKDMKKEVAQFVVRFVVCLQVKVNIRNPKAYNLDKYKVTLINNPC